MPDPGPFIAERPAPERKPPPWWVCLLLPVAPVVWVVLHLFLLTFWATCRITWGIFGQPTRAMLRNTGYQTPKWLDRWREIATA